MSSEPRISVAVLADGAQIASKKLRTRFGGARFSSPGIRRRLVNLFLEISGRLSPTPTSPSPTMALI
ncbi:hypothetical protein TIFTF001_006098 [Ficus carica]|uniref:Uncharacterized protein n=1 Tax=Ficus carica TaxID=3494 RepID=A0AA88CYC7_FICCA|nr:hypothetical protein TIFTF001_006098 [Ficus carica]